MRNRTVVRDPNDNTIILNNGFKGNNSQLKYNGATLASINNLTVAVGPKGLTGDTGPKGDKGLTGDQGDKGPVGNTGPQGDTGPTGDKGIDGPQGIQGIDGPKGDTGPKGDIGDGGTPTIPPMPRWHNLWRLNWEGNMTNGGLFSLPGSTTFTTSYTDNGTVDTGGNTVDNSEMILVVSNNNDDYNCIRGITVPVYANNTDGTGFLPLKTDDPNNTMYNNGDMYNAFNLKIRDGVKNAYQCTVRLAGDGKMVGVGDGSNANFVGIFFRPLRYFSQRP